MSGRTNILFVSGTDTGVGKTAVSALLVTELLRRGVNVGVLKSVETGCPTVNGELFAEDGEKLATAAGLPGRGVEHTVYRFREPAAPLAAARAECREVDPQRLHREVEERASRHSLLVVEGAGGLLVPFTPSYTFIDLMQDCGGACLLVVGSKLGAINHALLSLEALAHRRIPVLGYVVNRPAPAEAEDTLALRTNGGIIAELAGSRGAPPAFRLEFVENIARAPEISEIRQLAFAVIEYFGLKL